MTYGVEAIYLALGWPVVGGFTDCTKLGERRIWLLGGRWGWNGQCPGFSTAGFGLHSLISDYIMTTGIKQSKIVLITDQFFTLKIPYKKYKNLP